MQEWTVRWLEGGGICEWQESSVWSLIMALATRWVMISVQGARDCREGVNKGKAK